jgi:hypothetical protein
MKGGELSGPSIVYSPTATRFLPRNFRRRDQRCPLIDLAIAIARLLAAHRPTLPIIETDGLSMAEKFLSLFLKALSSPDVPFQSIVDYGA